MSPGVSMYEDAVAPTIAAHAAPAVSQRRHWNANEVGEPLHVPTAAGQRLSDLHGARDGRGGVSTAGRADGAAIRPARRRASAATSAVRVPPADPAVTVSASAWPTSAAVGVYVSSVAPGIGVQPAPAASQRLPLVAEGDRLAAAPRAGHAGELGAGLRGADDRGRRARRRRARPGYGLIANGRALGPFARSPSTQWAKPGPSRTSTTARTSSRARPSRTPGRAAPGFVVQCAIQSGCRRPRRPACRRARSSRSSATRR